MSTISELSSSDLEFLSPYLPEQGTGPSTSIVQDGKGELPFVTLTYASSLDSMIALAPGLRTTLSGPETKAMTHYLRLRHDAILIGAGTAVTDDPALNCRYPGVTLETQPRPVIIDPNCRFRVAEKKVFQLAAEGQGKAPWIFTDLLTPPNNVLEGIDGQYVIVAGDTEVKTPVTQVSSKIAWVSILKALKRKGIDSVMIEGGATVINTLLAEPGLVDTVIITIAPTWLGTGGVAVAPAPRFASEQRTNAAWLDNTSWRQFGNDVVLCGQLRDEARGTT